MKKCFLLMLVFFICKLSVSQQGVVVNKDSFAIRFSSFINSGNLKDNLNILTSDALEGRSAGTRGQHMAAAFIASHFNDINLLPFSNNPGISGYFQNVPLAKNIPAGTYILIDNNRLVMFKDFVYFGYREDDAEKKKEIVFIGKGSKEELASLDVKGKAVMFLSVMDRPLQRERCRWAADAGAVQVFAALDTSEQEFGKIAQRYDTIMEGGYTVMEGEGNTSSPDMYLVSVQTAAKIFKCSPVQLKNAVVAGKSGVANIKQLKKIKPADVTFRSIRALKKTPTENVIGYIEGTDKKDEYIVISAHNDHLGKDNTGVYHGADDDGSGTVAIMEIARVFAQAKKEGKGPRRTIVFTSFTGEENGLYGSVQYTSHPLFPLGKTIVNLNIDMIGRSDTVQRTVSDYVYLVGSSKLSSELHAISESVNQTYINLPFDYKYDNENDPLHIYNRSDHWNFAKNKVPVIFYFDGIHDDYHKTSDTIDKIDFSLMEKRTRLVFYTAWELANRENRPMLDKK